MISGNSKLFFLLSCKETLQNLFINSYSFNNPDLKEERTKSYEVGIEASMLNNRLTVDLSYYNSQVNDLLTPVDISNSTGLGAKWLNAGTIENKGVELMLSGTPIKVSDFSWNLSFNYSKNENLVIEGLLLTMYDTRLRLSNQVVEEVKSHFQDSIFLYLFRDLYSTVQIQVFLQYIFHL